MGKAEASARFRPEIEGLRAVAVLLVLLYHAQFDVMSGGFVGVDVFFVLSGFLITSLLLRELDRTGTISLPAFWARRARRLLPAAGLVVLATLVVGRLLLDGLSQGDLARDAIAASSFVANYRFLNVGTDYLAEGRAASPLLHYWSLAVEEQFYLVWPGLMLLLVRFARLARRSLVAVLALMWVATLLLSVQATHDRPMWAFFMLPSRAWELLSGAMIAVVGGSLWKRADGLRAVLGCIGLGTIIGTAVAYDESTAFPGLAAVVPVVATVAVINAGVVVGGPGALLCIRPMQWIGARSYAIYLWHFPVLLLAANRYGPLSIPARIGLLLAAVGLAALSYWLIESPIRFASALVASSSRSLVMGASVALVGVLAATVLLNNPPRLSTDEVAAAPTLVTATSNAEATTTTARVDSATTSTIPLPPTTMPRANTADASHDNPPELAGLIAANLPLLEQAVAIKKVPANLDPSLGESSKDLPQLYADECILDVGVPEPKECVYGDPSGSVTIVLFGDSHAAQWMPAINQVAVDHGWKLVVHTKKACPSAEIPTIKDPNRTDCAHWREAVIAEVAALRPDLVVMSGYRYQAAPGTEGRSPDEVWRAGTELTVSKLLPLVDHLLLIGDSATPAHLTPYCLAHNLTNVPNCVASRDEALRPSRLAVEREVAAKYDIDFIPTSDWMCTDSRCPVIVGNILMYRDDSHLTATAARFLSPYVEVALVHAMT
ncbi:MAG: acyltransferase [Actinobacteria bacterium]|nr:acyltransferase [Actinomycetota bacterium]